MLIGIKYLFMHDCPIMQRSLAAIAADELTLVTESIDRQLTVIAAILTDTTAARMLKMRLFLCRQDARFLSVSCFSIQRRPVSPHEPRNRRAYDLDLDFLFKGA